MPCDNYPPGYNDLTGMWPWMEAVVSGGISGPNIFEENTPPHPLTFWKAVEIHRFNASPALTLPTAKTDTTVGFVRSSRFFFVLEVPKSLWLASCCSLTLQRQEDMSEIRRGLVHGHWKSTSLFVPGCLYSHTWPSAVLTSTLEVHLFKFKFCCPAQISTRLF